MKLVPFICALLFVASFAQAQQPSPKLPCDYSGPLLQTREGGIVRFRSEKMKTRATHKADLDSPFLKQLDFRSAVVVSVLIGASGEVVCAKSVSGIPMARLPVEKALRAWTFKPEMQNGKPVAYLGQLDFLLCNTDCGEEPFGVTLLK
jgi:hypothetical protein